MDIDSKAPFTWDRNEVRAEWKSKLPACLHETGTKWRNTPSRVKPALQYKLSENNTHVIAHVYGSVLSVKYSHFVASST